jgi:hypothetical protein
MKRIARCVLVALLLSSATAHASPERVARALARDPVYVQAGADPSLSTAERGRLRLQIAREDIGRVKVAVVRTAEADEAGGTRVFANAIDHQLRGKVVALGDQIRDLDLDVEMPDADADPGGKAEYERALAIYDQANEALTARRTGASIQRARAALAEGRQRMEHARTLLEAHHQPDPR